MKNRKTRSLIHAADLTIAFIAPLVAIYFVFCKEWAIAAFMMAWGTNHKLGAWGNILSDKIAREDEGK